VAFSEYLSNDPAAPIPYRRTTGSPFEVTDLAKPGTGFVHPDPVIPPQAGTQAGDEIPSSVTFETKVGMGFAGDEAAIQLLPGFHPGVAPTAADEMLLLPSRRRVGEVAAGDVR
jgi:hypothetical protein